MKIKKSMTAKETVKYLDEYVIGQDAAKKIIAIALRNRYRRMQLDKQLQEDIVPKNILMIGNTGVGKTEIARRLAKLLGLPFVKVEASKYTEVGYVGRDVESMVRDLAYAALALVKEEEREAKSEEIKLWIEEKILDKLLAPMPKMVSSERAAEFEAKREEVRVHLRNGSLDGKSIELEITQNATVDGFAGELGSNAQDFLRFISPGKKSKKTLTVREARLMLQNEATEQLLDAEKMKEMALKRAANEGIIFIDEVDKIANPSGSGHAAGVSREGVQRDLLPIVEGSTVNTRIGELKTDHVLFIAAGAFAFAKPSDLIPELQGRFPLRVELDSLSAKDLELILTAPKNSLLKQYTALLATEGLELDFDEGAVKEIAQIASRANAQMEDIGARRLHTVIEKLLEDISYEAEEMSGQKVTINADFVKDKLDKVVEDKDLAKYIL